MQGVTCVKETSDICSRKSISQTGCGAGCEWQNNGMCLSKNGNIYAVYGDRGHPMIIPPAFQIDNIGVNIGGTNPIINNNVPEGKYDSWLTIGVHNSNIVGKVSSIGIDFSNWDENNGITVTDGAVFLIDPTVKLSKTNKYIIGHLTLKNSEDHTLNINVQGMTDIRLNYAPSTYVENNIVYNFKKKETPGH